MAIPSLVPARRAALHEGPDGDAVAVAVARQVLAEEGHVVDLAALGRRHHPSSLL